MLKDCHGQIVRAHTIPKSGSLRNISSNRHVYHLSIDEKKSVAARGPVLDAELTELNKASTFTGFCSHHDNTLFKIVEDNDFVGSPEQCCMLAFRSLAREHYAKEQMSRTAEITKGLDKGRNIDQQIEIQAIAHATEVGAAAALPR